MSDERHTTKADLLNRIESAWNELMETLIALDEAAKTRENPASGWAIRDHLLHLAAWERGVAYILTGRPRPEGMGISEAQWVDLTMDQINTVLFEAGRAQSGAEAMANLRMAHDEMLAALAGLSDGDLRRDIAEFDGSESPTNWPISALIAGNTYDHYEEHLGYIRAALA
jgi:hypothetical protein